MELRACPEVKSATTYRYIGTEFTVNGSKWSVLIEVTENRSVFAGLERLTV